MMRIMASLTKAATVREYRSKSRAKRRLRLIQARVRSTALGQDDELVQFVALDDLEHPTAGAGSGLRGAWSLIAGIGEDPLDEGEEAARAPIENQPRPVAVLNIAGMDDDVQQKAKRIDQDGGLAPGDLLARIVALRVERGAPFMEWPAPLLQHIRVGEWRTRQWTLMFSGSTWARTAAAWSG